MEVGKAIVGEKKKKSICFHHNDSDGHMSAAIVLSMYPDTEIVEVNYDVNETAIINDYFEEAYDFIFVVDFSFTEETMKAFQKAAREELFGYE